MVQESESRRFESEIQAKCKQKVSVFVKLNVSIDRSRHVHEQLCANCIPNDITIEIVSHFWKVILKPEIFGSHEIWWGQCCNCSVVYYKIFYLRIE